MKAYPELIHYPYLTRIPSDNGILGDWLSQAVTKSHIPISRRNIKGRPFEVGFDRSHQHLRKGAPSC